MRLKTYPIYVHSLQARAFSLVELSIVLVILGLLVGGVLAGQSLIEAAQLRKVITQLDQERSAVFAFRDKYFALPGDMTNASSFWTGDANCSNAEGSTDPSKTCNGNGDGIIGGTEDPSNPTFKEPAFVWNHLAHAGLIAGSYPAGSAGSGYLVFSPNPIAPYYANLPASYGTAAIELVNVATNDIQGSLAGSTKGKNIFLVAAWDMGATSSWPTPLNITGRALSAEQSYYIDSKVDDGKPYTGSITASWDQYGDYCGKSYSGTNSYTMTTTVLNVYNAGLDYAGCALYVSLGN